MLHSERERQRNHILLDEQTHRAELEEARIHKEEAAIAKEEARLAKEAARVAKESKKKEKKKDKVRISAKYCFSLVSN